MNRPLVCLLAALALVSPAFGQSTSFEVVSIKPAPQNKKELQQHLGTQIDPAMVDFGGVSLLMLLTRAYGLHSFQVLGAPELNTTRFNIVAKLPTGSSTAQVPEMLKTMLRERFRLEAHQETREFGVYALTAPKGVPKIPLNVNPTGTRLYIPWPRGIDIFDTATLQQLASIPAQSSSLFNYSYFSPDGSMAFLCGCGYGVTYQVDVRTNQVINTLPGQANNLFFGAP